MIEYVTSAATIWVELWLMYLVSLPNEPLSREKVELSSKM